MEIVESEGFGRDIHLKRDIKTVEAKKTAKNTQRTTSAAISPGEEVEDDDGESSFRLMKKANAIMTTMWKLKGRNKLNIPSVYRVGRSYYYFVAFLLCAGTFRFEGATILVY